MFRQWIGGRSAPLLVIGVGLIAACNDPAPSSRIESKPASSLPAKNATEVLLGRVESEPALACEISYEQTKEAMKTPPTIDAGPFPPFKMAPKDVYMADCLRMPRTVQKCTVFAYAFAHNAECERARAEYDAENQRRFSASAPPPPRSSR